MTEEPYKLRVRHHVGPTLTPITLKPDYSTMTDIDPRYAMPYSEFVKQTYAFASKNFFLESFQSIGANKPLSLDCSYGDHLEEWNRALQDETQLLRDLGDAYTAQIDELCRTIDILHACMALAGEVLELQQELEAGLRDATLKEIGDICYYLQMLANFYLATDDTIEALAGDAADFHHKYDFSIIQIRTEQIVDLIKRDVIYRQPGINFHQRFSLQCLHLLQGLMGLCRLLGTDLINVIAMNREKLIKRYPSGSFSTQESAAKADVTT